jgi:hypothetical protein
MGLRFPNGAVFGISTSIGAAVTASAVSNANPGIATVPKDSFVNDDVLVVSSAWPSINNVVTVADDVTNDSSIDTLKLLGLDTTDTGLHPTGGAAAKLSKASGFVDFSQQGDPSTSGGEQQFWSGLFLEDPTGQQINVPTNKSPKVLTLPLYYDPKLPWFAAAKAADAKKQAVVLRCKLPDGDVLYRYGYLSFDSEPSIAANTPMGNTVTFTALGASTLVEAA